MHTLSLNIEDSFFPHFKAMLDALAKEHKIEIIEEYDYENHYPQSVVVNSIEEVRLRAQNALERVNAGEFVTSQEYEARIEKAIAQYKTDSSSFIDEAHYAEHVATLKETLTKKYAHH